MNYEMWYNEEHGVLYFKSFRTVKEADVHEIVPLMNKLLEGKEHRYVLADLTEAEQNPITKEARRAFKQYAGPTDYEKVAIVGAKPIARMATKIILTIMRSSHITQFFKTESEALAWLKGEK